MDIKNFNYGVVGTKPEEIKNIYLVTPEEHTYGNAYVIYNNGAMAIKEFKNNVDEEFSNFVRLCYSGKLQAAIDADKGTVWSVYRENSVRAHALEEEYNKLSGANKEEKEENKNNVGPWILGSSVVLAGAGLGIAAMLSGDGEEKKAENTTSTTIESPVSVENTETEVKYAEKVDLTGKTWADIEEMIKNGQVNETQAGFITNMSTFLNNTNVSEDWEKVTLTDEELKEANELLKKLDKEELDSKNVRFGFTAEQVSALALRYNKYSNEEMAKILGGKTVDVNDIMNVKSNEAIRNIIVYLINSDSYEMNLGEVVKFSDFEAKKTEKLNSMLKEYKSLISEEKFKEAKNQMKEFEAEMIKTAYNEDLSNDYKELIINTYGASASAMCVANGYTELFTEETMKSMILGNSENDDVKRSIADEACGAQMERLSQYNTYINDLERKDIGGEAAFAATAGIDAEMGVLNNVETEYDAVTKDSLSMRDVTGILDEKLVEEEKDDENIQYFSTVSLYKKYTAMNEKAENSKTGGKVGQYMYVDENGNTRISDDLPEPEHKVLSDDDKKKKDDEEKKKAEADYQSIYNAAYNAFINGSDYTDYDHNDSLAAAAVGMARADADAYLAAKAKEGKEEGGEFTPVKPEPKPEPPKPEPEPPKPEPEPEPEPEQPSQPENPTDEDIDFFEDLGDFDFEGDLIFEPQAKNENSGRKI